MPTKSKKPDPKSDDIDKSGQNIVDIGIFAIKAMLIIVVVALVANILLQAYASQLPDYVRYVITGIAIAAIGGIFILSKSNIKDWTKNK
jgi:nitrate/nitrite transporter NarK